MKKIRRSLMIAALATIICIVGVLAVGGKRPVPAAEGNLIRNGDFSAADENGSAHSWTPGMWITSAGVSYLETVTLEDGTTAALIENASGNDARFEQRVDVREDTIYRLSAKVMAEGCDPELLGANVSFLGVFGTSEDVLDTDGMWKTIDVYARTGKGCKEATVCVRLGGYGNETTGRAWFTDVVLEAVSEVPVGAQVIDLTTPKPAAASNEKETQSPIVLLFVSAAVYLAVCVLLLTGMRRASVGTGPMLAAVLFLAGALRLVLAIHVPGYGVDMGCYQAWAGRMAAGGPGSFYAEDYFCDYPPMYLLVLWAAGAMANAAGMAYSGPEMQLLIKFTPIACDLILTGLLYTVAERYMGKRRALGLAVITAAMPAFIITGSCWGQIDSVLALMLAVMLLWAMDGRWQLAIPMFAAAVLTKPQAGLLAPLGAAALAMTVGNAARRKEQGRRVLLGIGLGAVLTAAVAWLFTGGQTFPKWLIELYGKTLASYDYATLSTGNLMFLLGGNWTANDTVWAFGLTYGHLGMGLMAASFAAGIALYIRGKDQRHLPLCAAVTLMLVFVLGSKMHERYVLPAIALLLLAYAVEKDIRLAAAAALSGAAAGINIGVVLAYDYLIAPNLWIGYLTGILQLAAAGVALTAAIRLVTGHAPMERTAREEGTATAKEANDSAAEQHLIDALHRETDGRLNLKKRDVLIMLAVTAAYACVAFWNLGTMKAPQDGYASSAAGESVLIDLGERKEDFRIYYYGGISDTQFSFAVSDDGQSFSAEEDAFFDRGECFKWQAVRDVSHDENGTVTGASGGMHTYSGRYIRVTFKGAGAALWEVAAVDAQGRVIPAVSASAEGGYEGRQSDAMRLIDEQDTVPDKPSYLNSMYFDEIYHARTGYEHANSLYTYETTHPPLGKVMMSWCIRLLGMTPFAWRLAGTVTGILMIPAMYLLAMQLLHRTRWATLCALLLALDCMHFTQTRIATIDSFPVLFMMGMFACMARYMQMSFYHRKLTDTLIPLAASGLFMGLAIASKWIGCYGAVGLAVLFFARMGSLYRQYEYARAHQDEDEAYARAARCFPRSCMITLGACVVFFVIVPVIIYMLSYIPYLRAYGEVKLNAATLRRIWDAQVLMYDYHKNLVAEHYFASPWYEWPLMMKPMWYYAADFKGAGMASSILAFGNPAVWWTGLAGILFVLVSSVRRNVLPMIYPERRRADAIDRVLPVIAVGFLSAYLPWVLVSRLTFIYHYFASVPFIILAAATMMARLEKKSARAALAAAIVLCIMAAVLFAAFYPLASGMEVSRKWCDAVSWFDNWMWY